MKMTASFTIGNGSLTHNLDMKHRAKLENVDPERIKDNIIFKNQPIKEAYSEVFGGALEKYNETKRADRKIHDYHEHIQKLYDKNLKKEKETGKLVNNKQAPFNEVVIQYGDLETAGHGTDGWDKSVEMLTAIASKFQEENPNIHVFKSILHLDEATPHLHIDFLPIGENYTEKRMEKQLGFNNSFEARYGKGDTKKNWKEQYGDPMMLEVAKAYGIEVEEKQEKRKHLTVRKYKEQVQTANEELDRIKIDKLHAERELKILNKALTDVSTASERKSTVEPEKGITGYKKADVEALIAERDELLNENISLKQNKALQELRFERQEEDYKDILKEREKAHSDEIRALEIKNKSQSLQIEQLTKENDEKSVSQMKERIKQLVDDTWYYKSNYDKESDKVIAANKKIEVLEERVKFQRAKNKELENENTGLKEENSKWKGAVLFAYDSLKSFPKAQELMRMVPLVDDLIEKREAERKKELEAQKKQQEQEEQERKAKEAMREVAVSSLQYFMATAMKKNPADYYREDNWGYLANSVQIGVKSVYDVPQYGKFKEKHTISEDKFLTLYKEEIKNIKQEIKEQKFEIPEHPDGKTKKSILEQIRKAQEEQRKEKEQKEVVYVRPKSWDRGM